MATKRDATPEVGPLIERLIRAHHPDVHSAGVTIDADFAFAGKKGGPAVKLHGYPCAATIKNNNVDGRRRGLADCVITIDGAAWLTWDDDQREALIDHEIEHIVILRDKFDQYKEDDAGRPVTRMKLHDYELGGFDVIARRHGAASFEVQHARSLRDRRGNLLFAWADDMAPAPEAPAIEFQADQTDAA